MRVLAKAKLFDTNSAHTLSSPPVNGTPYNSPPAPRHSPQNTADPAKVVAIIPARYNSMRLPGKPLLEIMGRPMVLHTVERTLQARSVGRVIVATDDERIYKTVCDAGFEAQMTSTTHATGTDRIAEVARTLENAELIVNVQGDEPLISPETIDRAVAALIENEDAQMATVCEPIMDAGDVLSADVVKVVTDERGRALYFSRSPIPLPRDLVCRYGSLTVALELEPDSLMLFRKHIGLYVYRRGFLLEYAGWQSSVLEEAEALEQLRALSRGALIQVIEAAAPSIGVDTEAALERVRAMMQAKGEA